MKIAILVVGRHEEIIQTLLRIIHKNDDWRTEAAMTDAAALALFDADRFDIVLLSSGIDEAAEQWLRQSFKAKDPAITIIQHYGGGSGLLSNEILQAMNGQQELS